MGEIENASEGGEAPGARHLLEFEDEIGDVFELRPPHLGRYEGSRLAAFDWDFNTFWHRLPSPRCSQHRD